MNLDELKQLREQITNSPDQVTDEQLAAAREAIQVIRNEQPAPAEATPETVALLSDLRDIHKDVKGQIETRAAAAAEVTSEAKRLLADFDESETPAEPETPAAEDDAPADPAVEQTPELELVAAAVANGIERAFTARFPQAATPAPAVAPQGRTGRPAPSTPPPAAPGSVAAAKVYLGSHSELGRPVTTELEVARAVHEKFRGAYQAAGSRGRMPVLTVSTEYPDERVLGQNSEANFEKIRNVTSPNSLVAAGGLCAPLEVMYDVEVIGSAERPLRDGLARFATERGGIQYRPNTSAAAAINGAGVWTMANDEAVDPEESDSPTKACYIVDCPDLEDANVQAIYSCLEFSNVTSRFDPETTASNVQQGLIAHARLAENELYNAMAAGSKLIYGAQQLGATRDILGYLDRVIAYYRNRHRLTERTSLTQVLPAWVRELVRADLARQMPAGDWMGALAVSDSQVDAFFATRNVSVIWFLDGSTADATVNSQSIPRQTYADVAAGAPIPPFKTKIDSLLFTTGSWLFLDGGSLDLGLVRDSELNSRNRYRQFSETFEGVADRGIESLRVLMPVKAIGTAAALKDMSSVTD